jgi:hypothetical protein
MCPRRRRTRSNPGRAEWQRGRRCSAGNDVAKAEEDREEKEEEEEEEEQQQEEGGAEAGREKGRRAVVLAVARLVATALLTALPAVDLNTGRSSILGRQGKGGGEGGEGWGGGGLQTGSRTVEAAQNPSYLFPDIASTATQFPK